MRLSLFLILLILVGAASVAAQTPRPSPTPQTDDQDQVRVFTEEVRLPVAARDSFGHYDPTLSVDDVLVLEDGEQQQIRSVQHLPTNVLLLLDLGNQLGLKDTNLTRQVAMGVVSALYPGNKIAIMQFASQPELLQTWTNDREAIAKVLKTKLKSGKSSRLSDAFVAAAAQFKDIPPGTRHIVIITDGVEAPGARVSMATAMKQLNSVQASVHIISYTVLERQALQTQTKVIRGGDGVQRDSNPGSNPVANGDPTLPPGTTRSPGFKIGSIDTDVAMRRKRKEYERATRVSETKLAEIADESGGQILLPASTSEVVAQAAVVAQDIGSQYVVTYRPTHPLAAAKAGEYRKVEIASRRVGLYLRSRRGYVVP
ncbi:MAG TPA: VWA domain-containing protein [Pyrinomonadaceae bacterium]|nr:VWA domain-containing protein [Pyrinomonadaceae bacterium]